MTAKILSLADAKASANNAQRGSRKDVADLFRSLSEGKVFDPLDPGSGISAGVGTVCKTTVRRQGKSIKTEIILDLTGLESEATLADIIGDNGAANCYIAQIAASRNGTILGGKVTCLEAPAGGEVDIDFYSAVEGTGVEGAAVTGLDETALLNTAADWTIDLVRAFTGVPADGEYIYLAVGTATSPTAGTYTAGKFLIEFWGYDA